MKKIAYIFLSAAMALGAVSCSKESPFVSGEIGEGFGRVLTSSLAVELKEDQTRAGNDTPVVDDFTVEFFKTSDLTTAVETFKYSEMPEIVTLPAGVDYKVVAHYGENPEQGWNTPYYYGESAKFSVLVDKIVDNLDPIKCKLSNVKVMINFDRSLASVMSADSKVVVNVGQSGGLTFTEDTQDCGYFAYAENSNTLAATFTGTVDGQSFIETKTYSDVKPGTFYNITFRLHNPNAAGSGTASPAEGEDNGIQIEAALNTVVVGGDSGIDVTPGNEIILDGEKNERPIEGGDEPVEPVDPNDPDNPDEPIGSGPTVTPFRPMGKDGNPVSGTLVDLDKVNNSNDLVCAFKIESQADKGFTRFEVDIISKGLTPEELSSFGLSSHLDLVNPGDLSAGLQSLGFPVNVGGSKSEDFDITSFMGMLGTFKGEHTFRLTISDDNGTTVVNLKIMVS